jgi:lactoylglutathione lyase
MVATYLSYFGIRVTDLERSVAFYTRCFGLEEVARGGLDVAVPADNPERVAGRAVLLRDPLTGCKLELNYYPEGSRFAQPYEVGEGLDHLCFRVEDMDGTLKVLEAEGVRPIALPSEVADGVSIAYVRDPNGIWIELWKDNRIGKEPLPRGY